MISKLLIYVLSHGCLLSSYKAFFNLHTWVYMSCVTSPCLRPAKRTRLQASNTRAKSPMNMYRHKICRNRTLKENALQYNMHKRNCLSYTAIIIYLAQRNQHSFTQAFILTCSSFSYHWQKYGCRSKNMQDHLSYDEFVPQPATSLQRSTQP